VPFQLRSRGPRRAKTILNTSTSARDDCISAAMIARARARCRGEPDVIREILRKTRRISGEFFGVYSHRGPRRLISRDETIAINQPGPRLFPSPSSQAGIHPVRPFVIAKFYIWHLDRANPTAEIQSAFLRKTDQQKTSRCQAADLRHARSMRQGVGERERERETRDPERTVTRAPAHVGR